VLEVSKTCNASRDRIVDALQAENILARKYFWPACHRMKPYRDLFPHAGLVLANTEALAERIVVLPAGSAVSTHDIELIARVISTVCAL